MMNEVNEENKVNEVNGEFGESVDFVSVDVKCKKGQKVKKSKVTFRKRRCHLNCVMQTQ